MYAFFHTHVRKEITIGVLGAGLILACMIWFLAFTQTKADAFNEYVNTNAGVTQF